MPRLSSKTSDFSEIFGNKRKFSSEIGNYLPNYGKKCGFSALFSCIFEISRIFATLKQSKRHRPLTKSRLFLCPDLTEIKEL